MTRSEFERLRLTAEECTRMRDIRNDPARSPRDGEELDTLLDRRRRAEEALAEYHAQPDCPWCGRGKLVDHGHTAGVLTCERDLCRSVALRGGEQ